MNNSRSCDCANGCYYVDNFFIAVGLGNRMGFGRLIH